MFIFFFGLAFELTPVTPASFCSNIVFLKYCPYSKYTNRSKKYSFVRYAFGPLEYLQVQS